MTPSLPERPNLEQIRNQAKGLLKAHRANDPEALLRVAAQIPFFPKDRPSKSQSRELLLADTLFIVAREHGFASWPKLKAEVERLARQAARGESVADIVSAQPASANRLIEGSTIGRYVITREMGRSTDCVYETADSLPSQPIVREIERFNDVLYQAWDPLMGRRVVIKVLILPGNLSDTQKSARIERFQHEAKATGSHPNIVAIHDVGEDNGRHFITMEYLKGHTLREILQAQPTLPAKETIEIALQLCAALGDAYSRVVVHRDVKPDKIVITPDGVVKLTGFGASRPTWAPHILAAGQATGTPVYMAPEQIIAGEVGHRSDLFSLGVCMYEMLTGNQPFQGDTLHAIANNVMATPPVMPDSIPRGLKTILQKALMKDVNLRYQSSSLMEEDLRAGSVARKLEHPPRKVDGFHGVSWQQFTERAQKVVFYAQEEAGLLGENYLSTEHLLLGLTREYDHVAGRILLRLGIGHERIRAEIEVQLERGDNRFGADQQLTPGAKHVIYDLVPEEVGLLNNNYIGTEHLLLGLIRDDEGIAGRVLAGLGVDIERARKEIRDLQNGVWK